MQDFREAVRKAASKLGFLEGEDLFIPLDSLMIVELVVALEEETGLAVPLATLDEDAFESVDSVSRMLTTCEVRRREA